MQTHTVRTYAIGVSSVALLLFAFGQTAMAVGRVQLEILTTGPGTMLTAHEWSRALSQAGIKNVRISTSQGNAKLGVEVRGSQGARLYVVTGLLQSRDVLTLSSGRYGRRDLGRLAAWLDDLAKNGPSDQREPRGPFGLTKAQFAAVHDDLSRAVGFATHGMSRREAVTKITRKLSLPLRIDTKIAKTLEDDTIDEELSSVACGTALAQILRPAGLSLTPHETNNRLELVVAAAQRDLEIWPIGWKPERVRMKVLPGMFSQHTINIRGVSAAVAIAAIGKQLGVPVLIDHRALAQHGIDPEKVGVTFPSRKTSYGIALRAVVARAKLKSELRVDEGDQPLLWITTIKPLR